MARNRKRLRFSAYVQGVDNDKRFILLDVWNIDQQKIFRDHVWIKWKANDKPQVGDCIVFTAKINWYLKSDGNRKRGLIRPILIERTQLK